MKKVTKRAAASMMVAAFAWSGVAAAAPATTGYGTPAEESAGYYAPGGTTVDTAAGSPCYTRYDYPRPGFGGNSDAHISADIESSGTLWVPERCAALPTGTASSPAASGQVTQ